MTGSILQNHNRRLKTRRRAVNLQRQKNLYFEYGLVWLKYGLNMGSKKTVFVLLYQNMGLVRVKYGFSTA